MKSRRALVLLAALWMLTLAGIQSVPLETHESFVLATAQEMKTSGDWIVPRYNEELRLQKPPMSYWATLLVSAADPLCSDIQIYHGRLVSLLAVLVMVLLTARTGEKLYGREAGSLAALFLLCTNGILVESHNAKPDALYAAFCTLQLFAWIDAWKADTPSRQTSGALLGWAAAGLATLTKGPQVPAIFLLGILVFGLCGPKRWRGLGFLKPVRGAFVFCLLVLPWWLFFQQRLRALGADIGDSQLSGSLLFQLPNWKKLLELYYVGQSLIQMLPVSLLLVCIVPPLIKKRMVKQSSTQLLVYVSIAMLLAFTCGGQYRKHYILPLLPVFSLLLSCGIRFVTFQGFSKKWIIALCAVWAAGAVGCVGFMVRSGAFGVLALYLGLSLLIVHLLKQELVSSFREQPAFTKQLLVLAAACIPLGAAFTAYSPTMDAQVAEQEFKKCVGEQLPNNARLVCWKTPVNVLPFFVRKPVCAFTNRTELVSYLATNQGRSPVFVVLPSRELPAFNEGFKTRIVPVGLNRREQKIRLSFGQILGLQDQRPVQNLE